jgi:hypothetical protein
MPTRSRTELHTDVILSPMEYAITDGTPATDFACRLIADDVRANRNHVIHYDPEPVFGDIHELCVGDLFASGGRLPEHADIPLLRETGLAAAVWFSLAFCTEHFSLVLPARIIAENDPRAYA